MNNENSYCSDYEPIVETTRGDNVIETVHMGAFCVCDSDGNILHSRGNPQAINFLRSSSKPLQAISFVEHGGVEKFNITQKELALMCASHNGTDDHAETALSILKKVNLDEGYLNCGTHPPIDQETRERLICKGEAPTSLRHNCSGKHSAMLAYSYMEGFPLESYIELEHPVQQRILQTVSEMWRMDPADVKIGIDGCSVPVFAIPFFNAALGVARLCQADDMSENRASACQKITAAMMAFPKMVAGEGRFDTALMRAAKGKVISKSGAEGYQIVGIMPGVLGENSKAVGIAIKTLDGDAARRSGDVTAIEILKHLGVLNEDELAEMAGFSRRPLYNYRKVEIGEVRPAFSL